MKTKIVAAFLLCSFGASCVYADHDDHHITFINQTTKKLKFDVSITGKNKDKTLHGHTANYVHIDDCFHKKDGKQVHKNFEIKIKHYDKYLQDGKDDLVVHRKCGEDLYIWHANGKYHTSDKAPHVQADLSGCNTDEQKPAILFAHGLNDSQKAWGKFAEHAKKNGWRVFRTSVSEDGSIAKRGKMLNKYIEKIADECKIEEGSLRIVAHSMGGLDTRYIVSKKLSSAKYIERIYTLATPHKGQMFAGTVHTSDAVHDLGITQMEEFNKKNPYKDFKVNDKTVPLLAIRFRCGNHSNSDGVVGVNHQTYDGAPYSTHIFKARHTDGMGGAACAGTTKELDKLDVLDIILKDHKVKELYKIPYKKDSAEKETPDGKKPSLI